MPITTPADMPKPPSSIARSSASLGLDPATRDSFAVAEAACELKLKRLTPAQVQALPDSDDENGAHRLDLLMELARSRDDADEQQRIVTEMETRFPHSPWLADALFSSGNMYLLKRDYPKAIEYYSYLAAHFPSDKNAAAAHWRAGWLSYRLGTLAEAERIFDEQIKLYPGAAETVSALYWRGAALRDAGSRSRAGRGQLSRRSFVLISITFMRRWRVSGWRPWAPRSRQCEPAARSVPAPPCAAAGRCISCGQPASGQSAAAGQCRPE